MGSLRSISVRLAGPLLLAMACTACIIEPNQIPDGSVVDDGGTDTDGGPDAGIVAGAVSATVGTSLGSSVVAWTGLQLAGSSVDVPGAATQVYIVGASDTGGNITMYLTGLVPTTTSVTLQSMEYQNPSTTPDSWTCPNAAAHCSGSVAVTSYDGHSLIGTFSGTFGQEASTMHTSALSLTNGAFSLRLP